MIYLQNAKNFAFFHLLDLRIDHFYSLPGTLINYSDFCYRYISTSNINGLSIITAVGFAISWYISHMCYICSSTSENNLLSYYSFLEPQLHLIVLSKCYGWGIYVFSSEDKKCCISSYYSNMHIGLQPAGPARASFYGFGKTSLKLQISINQNMH